MELLCDLFVTAKVMMLLLCYLFEAMIYLFRKFGQLPDLFVFYYMRIVGTKNWQGETGALSGIGIIDLK